VDIKIGFERGLIIGEETNRCRELSNTPGGDMTPAQLAAHARAVASGTRVAGVAGTNGSGTHGSGERLPIRVTILDEKKMKSLGLGVPFLIVGLFASAAGC